MFLVNLKKIEAGAFVLCSHFVLLAHLSIIYLVGYGWAPTLVV